MERTSVVIVGAGAVGCALAGALAPDRPVTVLERLGEPGQVTSLKNSGVIHSGIHLPPTYMKARLARRGKQLIEAHCRRHQEVAFKPVGMHILVSRDEMLELWTETGRLVHMLRRASAQKIPVHWVGRGGVRKREPCVDCLFGLYIPEVCIIDPGAFVRSLEADARAAGATFAYQREVREMAKDGAGWRIVTAGGDYTAKVVINAAGLDAVHVAKLAGFNGYSQAYYRGEYFEIDRAASGFELRGLVYPVHRPGRPGLGVHLTTTFEGRILIGPNATAIDSPADVDKDLTPAEAFHADAVKFLPGLKLEHLKRAHAGVRPKLTHEPGEQDFKVVVEEGSPRFVNLIGIESPGLTASMALAEHVRERLDSLN